MGNGGAMRVAPLGAYFAFADEPVIVGEAERSAAVTHGHPEGKAGAVAIALATAWATRRSGNIRQANSDQLKFIGPELLEFEKGTGL